MKEALIYLNRRIADEHGNVVTINDKWKDTMVDSFGTTVVFLDMDEQYGCYDNEWFKSVTNWEELTISEIIGRIPNESVKL